MVLRWFQLFLRKVDTTSHYFALFALSAKCRFQTSEGYKTSSYDWQNIFTVLYQLLLLESEELAGLGFARCQRLLRIQVNGVDLRLTSVANGVSGLYGGYMGMIQFLYSWFNSFSLFSSGISRFLLFSLILQVLREGLYYLFLTLLLPTLLCFALQFSQLLQLSQFIDNDPR